MFDQFKQIMELRKMQDAIKKQSVSVEVRGVKLTMRGDFEVTNLELSPELDISAQSKAIMDALREAREKIQKQLAQSLAGSL